MSRTHTQIMQEVVDKYMASGQPWPATSRQMAEWAIQHNQWMPPRASLVHLCADQLARAMSEEYITDAQGRRVRAKHVVRTQQGGKQLAATPKFEVKRPGASGHSNDCMDVPFSGYFASNFAGAAIALCFRSLILCNRVAFFLDKLLILIKFPNP
jgi:hypothetical protein